MRRVSLLAFSLVLLGAPALAQPAPQEAPPEPSDVIEETASEAAPPSDDSADEDPIVVEAVKVKKVCRRSTPTGSRVPVKVCRTVREDQAETEATREVMTELQSAGGKENEYDENGIIKANPF